MKNKVILGSFVSAATFFVSLPASALEFENNGITGNLDTTLSWGAARRVSSRDPALIGRSQGGTAYSVNGDDGNRNYKKGLISNAFKITSDLDLNYKNYGAFFRGSYFFDTINNDKSSLTSLAKDRVGKDARMLDAYISGSFNPGGKALDIRIGRQVVSWGESTFIQNSINSINPVNVASFRVPGAELREGLLPVPMLWLSQEITNNVSLEAVYLTRFDHTEIDPRGTYFSTNDYAGDSGQYVVLRFGAVPDAVCGTANPASALCVPRDSDKDAKDSGQFGLALRVLAPDLNDTEFGFFFMNYHSRLPIISAKALTSALPSSGRYFVEYPEDIKMYGISFNTEVQKYGVAVQGEYSHRTNVPLQVDDVELLLSALCSAASQLGACPNGFGGEISGYRRHKVGQFQFTVSKVFGSSNPFNANSWVLLAEVGVSHVYNMPDKGTLRYEGPGTPTPGDAGVAFIGSGTSTPFAPSPVPQEVNGFADATSWGYRIVSKFNYDSSFGAATLSPRIVFAHDVNGTSPGPGGNFIEGRKAITLGMGFNYLNKWTGDFSYTNYFGAGNYNLIHDRDFIAMNVKYSF